MEGRRGGRVTTLHCRQQGGGCAPREAPFRATPPLLKQRPRVLHSRHPRSYATPPAAFRSTRHPATPPALPPPNITFVISHITFASHLYHICRCSQQAAIRQPSDSRQAAIRQPSGGLYRLLYAGSALPSGGAAAPRSFAPR